MPPGTESTACGSEPTDSSHTVRGDPIELMERERTRLAPALLLSLLIHALLLGLTFDGRSWVGGFGSFWQIRKSDAPALHVVLVPPDTPALSELATSAGPTQPAMREPLVPDKAVSPWGSLAPAPGSLAVGIAPRASATASSQSGPATFSDTAKPEPLAKPDTPSKPEALAKPRAKVQPGTGRSKADSVVSNIGGKARKRSDRPADAAVPPVPPPDVIALDRSEERAWTVPISPAKPDVAVEPTPSITNPETASRSIEDTNVAQLIDAEHEASKTIAKPTEPAIPTPAKQDEPQQQEMQRQEAARNDDARAEAARLEAEQQEAARQAAAQEEAQRQEAARQAEHEEVRRQEAARQAAAEEAQRQEIARRALAQQEAARAEAERLAAERQEAARRAAAQEEAQRQEILRQEAARAEAEQLEAERQEAARQAAAQEEVRRQEAARQAAAQQEAQRQEAARQAAAQEEAQRQEAARQAAAQQEAQRQGAAQQEAQRQAAAQQEVARQEAARQYEAKREERLRAIGRQLDEEAARREAASNPPRASSTLPLSLSTARRIKLWGRYHVNLELVRYAEAWARRIQFNTPVETVREIAKNPHRAPMVTVAIRSDGSVESVTFEVSSGVAQVDEALRRIVDDRRPYEPFQPELARDFDVIEIRRTWHFGSAVQLD